MNGVYNVPSDPGTPYPCYRTVAELPSHNEFIRESETLASELRVAIVKFLNFHGTPEYNEILEAVFGQYHIGEYPSDRTMSFFIGSLDAFVPELIAMFQKDILVRFPLWRLRAQFEGMSIGVYPDSVWFDDNLVTGSFTAEHPAYQGWFEYARQYREARFGPLSRQLAFCRRKIPEAMERLVDCPYQLIGVFGSYQPHLAGVAVWVLHDGSRDLSFDDECSPVRTSAVGVDGEIYPQCSNLFYPTTNRQPPFWLKTHLVDPDEKRILIVKENERNEIGRIEWDTILNDNVKN